MVNQKKNKKENKKDWSLLLSVIAIIISIISLGNDIYTYYVENKEEVNVVNSGFEFDEIIGYNSAGGLRGQGIISAANYTIIISNNSKQKVSIVSDELNQIIGESKVKYGNMINQITDSDGQPINYPITIDAGESILLKYKINMLIPSSINMLLLEKYGTESEIVYKEVQSYLGNNGRDIFGNEIKYTEYAEGTYLIESDTMNFPVYYLQLKTARGNYIETILTQ